MHVLSGPVAPLEADLSDVTAAWGYKENFIPQGFEIPGRPVQVEHLPVSSADVACPLAPRLTSKPVTS